MTLDAERYLKDMASKSRTPMLAKIREDECIGCTKCIKACPVDSIIGSAKHMHTVLNEECTGCALCVEPCPVDCIDLVEIDKAIYNPDKARARFHAKQLRMQQSKQSKPVKNDLAQKKAYIEAALMRAKHKKKTL